MALGEAHISTRKGWWVPWVRGGALGVRCGLPSALETLPRFSAAKRLLVLISLVGGIAEEKPVMLLPFFPLWRASWEGTQEGCGDRRELPEKH